MEARPAGEGHTEASSSVHVPGLHFSDVHYLSRRHHYMYTHHEKVPKGPARLVRQDELTRLPRYRTPTRGAAYIAHKVTDALHVQCDSHSTGGVHNTCGGPVV